MKFPEFICVGAQKSGTTTLHVLLDRHPKVFLPANKEVHYFDLNYHKGSEWYSNHFALAKTSQICGEITPLYLFHQHAAGRIRSLMPKIKIIILLRNPVNRTISHIFHAQKRGYEPFDIEKSIDAEEERLASGNILSMQRHSYVSRSRYMNQLLRYEEHFKSNQLLILKSEDLFEKPDQAWIKIMQFLNLKIIKLPKNIPTANKGDNYEGLVSKQIRKKLRDMLSETYSKIGQRYGIEWE